MKVDPHIKGLEDRIGAWVIRHRWLIILASLLMVVVAGSGIRFLTFDRDLRVFFGEGNPQLKAFEALEDTYTKGDNILFVLAPKNGNVFTRENLSAVEELTKRSWHVPYASRVDSLANYQHTRIEGDDLFVKNLFQDAMSLSDDELTQIRGVALSEPSLVNFLVSPSGHVTGLLVTVLLPESASQAVLEVADSARKLAKDLRQKHPDLEVHITGDVMFDDAYGRVSKDDLTMLVPVMVFILAFTTTLMLRSIAGAFGALLVVMMAVATGLGVAGWIGLALNPAAANAPTIILTVAVADSVHILATMFQQMRGGHSKSEAIAESLRLNLRPVLLTSVTTAIGFLTLNFSESPPFRDLGNIVAVGVMAALAYSLLFLPTIMIMLPVRPSPDVSGARVPWDRFASFVINKRVPVFWITLMGSVLVAVGVVRIELGDDWIKYFDSTYDFRIASDFTAQNLTGMQVIEYSLKSGKSGGVHDPEYLRSVDEFATWYRDQPRVAYVGTITDTVKRLNETMHGGEETYYRIPRRRDLVAQYLLLYELSLPFGLDLNHRIDVDKSATRMTVFLRDITTSELRATDARAREWLLVNGPADLVTSGTGPSMVWAYLAERNIISMLGGSFSALVLISGILLLAWRSLPLGLVSLLPNLAPAIVAFGLWGLMVGQVGLGLSVVTSLTLGIIVDDTVHFMSKYLRARRELGRDPAESVRYAFNTVGVALWVTSMILVAGFLVLAFSGYRMNADMGLMSAITIGVALALDFLLLPTLLMKVEGVGIAHSPSRRSSQNQHTDQ